MKRGAILLGLALSVSAASARGQSPSSANASDRTSWYRIEYVKFKPGAAGEAKKLVYDHFWPVDKELGRDVIPLDPVAGEWDHIVAFPMSGSPTQIALDATALDKRWEEVLARREGGKAQAAAIIKRYMDLVMTTKSDIALRHLP